MVTSGHLESVPVASIELDRTNPRIRKFLEMYPDTPSVEQMYLALNAAGDEEGQTSTSFEKLRNSILTNGGIIHPVILNRRPDGTLVCIEGNTRVAIYKNFLEEKTAGNWSYIPALVHEQMDDNQADAIRLQVHLVGTREWDPYSKAKYLHHLRTQALLPFSQIVDFCGGRQKEVLELINAYSDMEKYYRDVVPDDGSFDTSRFSGFVELQKPGVKEAVAKAGFTLTDFSKWIHEQKLYPLYTVRSLHRILANPKARDLFLKYNAKKAMEALDRPDLDKALVDANIEQLSQALTRALYALPWTEAQKLRKDPGSELAQNLSETLTALTGLLNAVADGGASIG
jgi:hypothetical protein